MKLTVILLSLALVLLAACEADPTVAPNPPAASPRIQTQVPPFTPRPNSTRVIVPSPIGPTSPPATRGPGGSIIVAGVGTASRELTRLPAFVEHALFDSLLRVDPEDGHLLPGLAERWLVSEDAKTMVFILREGVKWHDGSTLTAGDVAFTLNAVSSADVRIRPAADLGPIQGITAKDARTVSVTFREPYCAALAYIGMVPILPRAHLENKDLANLKNEDLIGSGPLVLKSWDEQEITLTRNANYWNGAPQIIDWSWRGFPDEAAALNAVRQNRADVYVGSGGIPETQAAEIPANEFYALAFNVKRKPFDEPTVRQAIAAALDRARIAKAQAPSGLILDTSLLPDFWVSPNVSQTAYDAARARQLLADAGWRDTDGDGIVDRAGRPLQVTLWAQSDEPRSELTAQLLREGLARVGVSAVLKMTDRTLFLTRVFLQEFDLALVHFNIPLDPDQHYFWATAEDEPGAGLNVTGYLNERVEKGLAEGNRVNRCDSTGRKNAYIPVFQQIASDMPMVILYAPMEVLSTSERVGGTSPSSFAGAFWNLNTWQVAQ